MSKKKDIRNISKNMFINRKDAGTRLAKALQARENFENTVVIALPRGGVIVGYEISQHLNLPLDVICPRKITTSENPEFAIGAVTESGDYFLSENLISRIGISKNSIQISLEAAKKEAQRRVEEYRKGLSPQKLEGKTIILVDDGLATGSTMKAAVNMLKAKNVQKIIIAVPVAPKETLRHFADKVNETICLYVPDFFYAVGQFYEDFSQVSDEEVMSILEKSLKPTGS